MAVLPAVSRYIFRQNRRAGFVWGLVYSAFAAVSGAGYGASYPSVSDRLAFANSLGANAGVRALFGPARQLETVQGFIGWRCLTPFMLLGATWGFLLATKVLRLDEEEGRAELLYAAPVTRAGGIRQCLGGLFAVWSVLFGTVLVGTAAVGQIGGYYSLGAGVFFAVVACAGSAMGLAVGAVTSQLTITRRAASSLAGATFGVAFILRAVGETVEGARWLLWLSPVSWLDRARPLTGSRAAPLLLVVVFVAACMFAAAALARRRDLGAAILPSRDAAEPRTGLLSSNLGLSTRLVRPTIVGWGVGVFVAAAIFGTVSSAVSDSLASNQGVTDIFARLGSELSAKGYVGVTFVLLGQAVSATAASLVGATSTEESQGRLEYLAATPMSRSRWLTGRFVAALLTLCAIGAAAGVGGWIGVRLSGGGIALGAMLLAGANIVPPGVLTLGLGTLVYGVAARHAVTVAYVVVVWSFLVEMVGGAIDLPDLIANTSLIHHLNAAPLVGPDWRTHATMVVAGLAAAALGAVALQRRDLQPG